MSTPRARAVADVALAVATGLLLTAAALHFATPCPEATLCALAVTPTRTTPWQRLRMWAAAHYWRLLHRAAMTDLEHQLEALEFAPLQIAHTRKRIAWLQRQVQRAEGARP